MTGAAFFATGAAFAGGALLTARVAMREDDARSTEAGAKAAAPATRVERTASFILGGGVVWWGGEICNIGEVCM